MARTQVQAELIATNAISGTIIADNAITATHIATNSISGTLIQDSGIVTSMIAANNITSTKIVTDAVLTRHIADDQVTEAKLANAINTSIAAKLPLAGGTMTGTIAGFTSTGIDDNADATAITIDSSERVGIGNTSPDGKLHVQSATAGSVAADAEADELILESSSNTGLSMLMPGDGLCSILFGNPGTNGQKDGAIRYYGETHSTTANRRNMVFTTGNSEAMRIDSSGNVGIGTTSPAAPLDVVSNSSAVGIELRGRSADNIGQLTFESNDSGTTYSQLQSLSTELKVKTVANIPMSFHTNNTERMRIDNSGKVGIGTTSPDEAQLLVQSTTEIATGGSYNTFGNLHVSTDTQGQNNGGTISMGGLGRTSGPTEYFRFAQISGRAESASNGSPDGYMAFEVTSGVTNLSTERMRIASTGHLLVGRTTTSVGGEGHRIDPNGESFLFANTSGALSTLHVYDTVDSAYRFYVDAAGTNAGRINATQTSIQSISDIRLKENVRDLEMGMNDLMKLKPRTFDWKEGEGAQIANASGFIAQEAEAAGFEEFIGDYKHEKIKDAKSFGQGGLVPLLVKCIQELEIRVKELEG